MANLKHLLFPTPLAPLPTHLLAARMPQPAVATRVRVMAIPAPRHPAMAAIIVMSAPTLAAMTMAWPLPRSASSHLDWVPPTRSRARPVHGCSRPSRCPRPTAASTRPATRLPARAPRWQPLQPRAAIRCGSRSASRAIARDPAVRRSARSAPHRRRARATK